MHKERLSQMVVMLRSLPPEGSRVIEFNLDDWHCGTSACAVGHACISPMIVGQWLTYDSVMPDPVFEGKVGWPAVERFFDLSTDEAEGLFGDWRYEGRSDTTPEQVATRIEEFIAEQA